MNVLFCLLSDRRMWAGAFPLTLLMLAALNVFVGSRHEGLVRARRENLLVSISSGPVRYDPSVGEHLERYVGNIPDARRTKLVVLAGMSQMYAINERVPGDQTIAEWLDDALAPSGVRVFGLAAPNLSNEEAILYLLATTAQPETHPAAFIYAVCFDKLRNVDLRPGLRNFLASRSSAARAWNTACDDGLSARYPMACEKMKATAASLAAPSENVQVSLSQWVEEKARSAAAHVIPIVEDRQNLNAEFLQRIFTLRNEILNIKPTTKRPIIASRYDLNVQFIQLMADLAERRGVKLFYYIIPLNPISDNPYVAEQYAAFKEWIEKFARERRIAFANLENIVPAGEWGSTADGPDFKHFKGTGHRLTAQAILAEFGHPLRDLGRAPVAQEAASP